jgi:hypothetical protein
MVVNFSDCYIFFQNRIEENRIKLSTVTQSTSNSSKIWLRNASDGADLVSNLLTSRQEDVLCSVHSLAVSPAEEDGVSSEEESSYATSTVMENAIKPVKLPEVPKLPPYTTWTFLDRSVYNYMHFSTSPNLCCVQTGFFVKVSYGSLETKYISWFHAGTRGCRKTNLYLVDEGFTMMQIAVKL